MTNPAPEPHGDPPNPSQGERDLTRLLAGLQPVRRVGTFVMTTLAERPLAAEAHATVGESEGLTVVVSLEDADSNGWDYDVELAWITLQVHSALDAVGLTANVSAALAAEEISCNVLAGRFHDHLLIPEHQAEVALDVLRRLSQAAAAS